jgi:hypothetical protein
MRLGSEGDPMRNRYLILLLAALAIAVPLSMIRHATRHAAPVAANAAEAPAITVRIEIQDGVVAPARASVPKDHRVALEVVNRGTHAASVSLAGYEDRVAASDLAPGATWSVVFLADRPGEDFPWLVDGRPAGRFVVAGEHLAERRR